jgi:hypothetical protein
MENTLSNHEPQQDTKIFFDVTELVVCEGESHVTGVVAGCCLL